MIQWWLSCWTTVQISTQQTLVSALHKEIFTHSWYDFEGTMWTPLHAAAFQEHGKVIKLLLERQADPSIIDYKNCSPVDFASVSEGIWPFFAGQLSWTYAP
jgi:hypothetical protein